MKLFLALILSALSFSVIAQEMTCLDKLLPYNRHSGVHMLTREQCSGCVDVLNKDSAKMALKTLLNSRLFCNESDVTLTLDPICDFVSRDIPESNVCYLKTNLGYFFISKDYARNFTFIFTRNKATP